jgi:hypothetical protein
MLFIGLSCLITRVLDPFGHEHRDARDEHPDGEADAHRFGDNRNDEERGPECVAGEGEPLRCDTRSEENCGSAQHEQGLNFGGDDEQQC